MNENVFKLYTEHKHLYLFQSGQGSVLFTLLPFDKTKLVERIVKAYPALTTTIEDNIWEECVVEHSFPSRVEDMDAGIVSTITRLIMRLSSPNTIEEIQSDLDKTRENLTDIRDQIVTKICEAFPAYTPEEVEAMDWQTQIKRLAQAEKVLGTEFSLNNGKGAPAKPGQKQMPGMQTEGVAFKMGDDGKQYVDFNKENAMLRSM